jgi:hypothetical protein
VEKAPSPPFTVVLTTENRMVFFGLPHFGHLIGSVLLSTIFSNALWQSLQTYS